MTIQNHEQIAFKLRNKNEKSPERVRNMINFESKYKILESATTLSINLQNVSGIDQQNTNTRSENASTKLKSLKDPTPK